MKKITAKWLTKKNACTSEAEKKEAEKIGDIFKIVDILIRKNRLQDANWLLSRYFKKSQNVKYAIYAAEQVIGFYEKKYKNDNRPQEAIRAAKKYLNRKSKKNKAAATDAAKAAAKATTAAAYDAYAATDAAYAAAYAATAATDAAKAAAKATTAAAYAAATNAAYAAAYAATDAAKAAKAAAAAMRIKILKYGISILKGKKK